MIVDAPLLERLDALIGGLRGLKKRLAGGTEPDEESLREVDLLVEQALAVLATLDDAPEDTGGVDDWGGSTEPAGDASEDDRGGIADLAWVGRGETGRKLDELSQSRQGGESWLVLRHADAALEAAERALVAVEAAVQRTLGVPVTDRFRERLVEALQVRRSFQALRRTFLLAGSPGGRRLRHELRQVKLRIETIRRQQVHGLLRVDDRRHLDALQARIDDALADSSDGGERLRQTLWQDLEAFSQLLMAIHQREDLRTHDQQLIATVRGQLADGVPAPLEVLRRLAPLLGRDEELDLALVGSPEAGPAVFHAGLARVEERLRAPAGP